MKLLIFLFLQSSLLFSHSNLDSLIKSLSGKVDSVKVILLTDFTWNNRSKDPVSALRSGQEALKIAQSINNIKLQAKALNMIGVVYRNLGEFDKALISYKDALGLAETINDSAQIAYAYNNIGGIYRLKGSNIIALDYILSALKVFEKLGDKAGMSFCTINIGLIYRRQGNTGKALEYLEQTLKLREELDDRPGIALALNHIAEVYFELGDMTKAMKYYIEVEKQYKELDDKKGLAAIWGGMAGVFYNRKDYTKALEYRKRALDMSYRVNYLEGQIINRINLGLIYAHLGKFNDADTNFTKALTEAGKLDEIYITMECYNKLTKYYEIKKDFQKALFYSAKYHGIKDSVNQKENIARISEIEAIYQKEKGERENFLLIKDLEQKEKQRNYLIVIVLLILVVALVLYSRYRSKKVDSDQLVQINTMKDTLLRIIAHDLKTPFNVIFGYTEVLREDFDNISKEDKLSYLESIRKASRLSIQLLENLTMWSKSHAGKLEFKPEKINLNEIVRENIYLLDATAENKKIKIESNVPEDVEVYADENMLNTVLRNLISNGIKFTNEGGLVTINSKVNRNFVEITVEDNGIGMDDVTKELLFNLEELISVEGTAGERGTGFGLVLCKEFVTRNGGSIWAESELGKGSRFIFTIPIAN